MVPGIPKGGDGGSPSERNGGKEDPDDPPKDDKGNSDSPPAESQLPPAPESSESHSLDDPPLSTAKIWHSDHKNTIVLIPSGFSTKQDIVLLIAWEILAFRLLPIYVGSLYTIWNYSWKFR